MEPSEPRSRGTNRLASIVAGLAFTYALVVTVVVLAATRMFEGEDNQRTMLAWLALPVLATFLSWLAVSSADSVMRIVVWIMVLATLFFCWISIFSFGIYFLPAPLLLIIAVLSPWRDEDERE